MKDQILSPRVLLVGPCLPDRSRGGCSIRFGATAVAISAVAEVSILCLGCYPQDDLSRTERFCQEYGFIFRHSCFSVPSKWLKVTSVFRFLLPKIYERFLPGLPLEFRKLLEDVDVLWLHHTGTLWSWKAPRDVPVILDIDDLDENTLGGSSVLRRFVRRRLISSNRNRLMKVARVSLVCSERDRLRLGVQKAIQVLPNTYFVDGSFVRARDADLSGRILFIGNFEWLPNAEGLVWLTTEVWPVLSRLNSAVTLRVVGRGSDKFRSNLKDDRIIFTGELTNISDELAQASVSVVPILRGSGTRIKILESFACGVPVVSTSIGAEGLVVEDREDLLLADSPQEFAEAVYSLLTDSTLRARVTERAREGFDSLYSMDRYGERLQDILKIATSEAK